MNSFKITICDNFITQQFKDKSIICNTKTKKDHTNMPSSAIFSIKSLLCQQTHYLHLVETSTGWLSLSLKHILHIGWHKTDVFVSGFTSHFGTRIIVSCQSWVHSISTNQTLLECNYQVIHGNLMPSWCSNHEMLDSLFMFPELPSILPRLHLAASCPAIARAS